MKYCCNVPKDIEKNKIEYIADILIKDVTNFINGSSSKFLDYQYLFDLDFFNYIKEEKLPTTYCNFCKAFNKKYIVFDSNYMDFDFILNERFKTNLIKSDIKYKIGGIRSRSEYETKKALELELDRLGAKIRIEPAYGNPFNDNNTIHCYNSFIEQTSKSKYPYLFRKNEGAGKGLTKSQSYFSAAFELIEHVGLQYTGDITIVCAKYTDVKEIAIDLPYLATTIMNNNTIFDNFDENMEVDWVVATSLTNGSKKLVPAFLIFMYDVELKGVLFGGTSNGSAIGVTLEDAILHGLFEAIERDAWLIGQSNPYILPIVDYESITNIKIKKIISKIKNMGYEIITRDYTNDLKIPVFRTWIVNRNDYSRYAYNGFGCHVSPEIALERSITEAVQVDDWSISEGELESDMITPQLLSKSLVNLYNQHFLVNKDIFGKTDRKTIIEEPIFEMNSSYEVIKNVANLIRDKVGGDVYYVEMTKPGMNVKIARTVITGDFQKMNVPLLSASKRMFEFGIRCGYSDKKTTYEELFMGNYAL